MFGARQTMREVAQLRDEVAQLRGVEAELRHEVRDLKRIVIEQKDVLAKRDLDQNMHRTLRTEIEPVRLAYTQVLDDVVTAVKCLGLLALVIGTAIAAPYVVPPFLETFFGFLVHRFSRNH